VHSQLRDKGSSAANLLEPLFGAEVPDRLNSSVPRNSQPLPRKS
jgi:hypothetical protein